MHKRGKPCARCGRTIRTRRGGASDYCTMKCERDQARADRESAASERRDLEQSDARKVTAKFEILIGTLEAFDGARFLVIRDLGPWDQYLTITNDAVHVVEVMAPYLEGRRLAYFDSGGDLAELVLDRGRMAGFAPMPSIDLERLETF
jgi:hypothetical protein